MAANLESGTSCQTRLNGNVDSWPHPRRSRTFDCLDGPPSLPKIVAGKMVPRRGRYVASVCATTQPAPLEVRRAGSESTFP